MRGKVWFRHIQSTESGPWFTTWSLRAMSSFYARAIPRGGALQRESIRGSIKLQSFGGTRATAPRKFSGRMKRFIGTQCDIGKAAVWRFMTGVEKVRTRKSTAAFRTGFPGSLSRATNLYRVFVTRRKSCLAGSSVSWAGCEPNGQVLGQSTRHYKTNEPEKAKLFSCSQIPARGHFRLTPVLKYQLAFLLACEVLARACCRDS